MDLEEEAKDYFIKYFGDADSIGDVEAAILSTFKIAKLRGLNEHLKWNYIKDILPAEEEIVLNEDCEKVHLSKFGIWLNEKNEEVKTPLYWIKLLDRPLENKDNINFYYLPS